MPFSPGLWANRWKGVPGTHGRTYPPAHIIYARVGKRNPSGQRDGVRYIFRSLS